MRRNGLLVHRLLRYGLMLNRLLNRLMLSRGLLNRLLINRLLRLLHRLARRVVVSRRRRFTRLHRCRRAWLCRRIRRLILVLRRTRGVLLRGCTRCRVNPVNTNFTYAIVGVIIDVVLKRFIITTRLHAF
ncbi:hypothetical protein ENKO_31810 [Enterobacter kobei]|uniref:Uncharacterized protein n=1 Tax=Enterobacter kobei TaxID=208224 RepID=A0AA86IZ04_9ENTR|nr:hypothetical protein ENKO_31810 [Enterobacter kobei]